MKKKMFIAGMSLAVALVLLATASFAWVTISTSPEVKGMDLALYTDRTLLLAPGDGTGTAPDSDEFKQYISLSSAFKGMASLRPVSTADGINWFLPAYDTESGDLGQIEDFILDDTLQYANVSVLDAGGDPLTGEALLEAQSRGYYVYTDFWMKTEEDGAKVRLSIPHTYADTTARHSGTGEEPGLNTEEIQKAVYGTYVLGEPELDESDVTKLKARNEEPETALRVGFLIYQDTETLKPVTEGIGANGVPEEDVQLPFMIYEPNADKRAAGTAQELLIPDKEGNTTAIRDDYVAGSSFTQLEEGKYYATQPIAKDEDGGITLQTVSAENMIVQMASAWDTASVIKTMNGQWGNTVKKPNSNDVETFGEFIDMDGYDADVNTPILLSSVAEETGNAGSNIIVELDKETPIRVRLFVWLEGQDVDCWNDIAAGTFRINLELAGETVNKGKGYEPEPGEEPEPVLATLKGYGTGGSSSNGWFDSTAAGISRNQITALEFVKSVPTGYTATWNAGTGTGAEAVNAYLTGTTVYIVLPDGADKILLPEDSRMLFSGLTECTSITGTEYLDISNVTQMTQMFYNCSKLTVLDLSSFNTSKVTAMNFMFYGCSNLTSLIISGFDTSKVTNMGAMFCKCSSLANLDVSGFDTSSVVTMSQMFKECATLTALDLPGFDTSKVTSMQYMFYGCSSLTSLDVSGFDTSKVTNLKEMFYDCSSLTTIYAGSGFTTSNVTASAGMFTGSTALVGGNGTPYSSSYTDKTYARIDKAGEPGYFTDKNASPQPMVTCTLKGSGSEGWYNAAAAGITKSNVTELIFTDTVPGDYTTTWNAGTDEGSINAYRKDQTVYVVVPENAEKIKLPADCNYIFSYMVRLETISGLDLLDTSEVTDMSFMFASNSSMTSVDVRSFDTSNVTTMRGMFVGCRALTSLDLSGLDTSNVTSLKSLVSDCDELVTVDISSFDTADVTDMMCMFAACPKLKTIYAGSGWSTASVTDSTQMFVKCTMLTGGNGTPYSSSKVDKTYARIDKAGEPGYFTAK